MCGIAGIVDRNPHAPIDEGLALAMRDSLLPRGPDDGGLFREPGIALTCRRLSIVDLSERGHMPMSTPDGRYWITYNGEIYNAATLRGELEARGHRFHSRTDTEVLLRFFAEESTAMLPRLNGMFAFAVWDRLERTLWIARDRLGVKPLVYAVDGGRLLFASEEKALFEAGFPAEPDEQTLAELLCFRYVAGERTPFRGIRRLLPGHWLRWRDGAIETGRWWNLAERARSLRGESGGPEWFAKTFDDSVALRRIADVPVGVLLSGGLDSSSVAASLASQGAEGLASFTVRFPQPEYDEGPLARELAERAGLSPHELTVADRDLPELLRRATRANDEPLAHGNDPHLLAISEHARPRVTVLLSGEGGDETLSGYVRYRPLAWANLLRSSRMGVAALAALPGSAARVRKLSRFLELPGVSDWVLFNAADVLPGDLTGLWEDGALPRFDYRERVLEEAAGLYPGDLVRQAMYSDQLTFLCSILDRNDRMTMAASIECRVPFLDYRLVEGLSAMESRDLLSGRGNKPLLRRALGRRLPPSILRHRKWGFGVPWDRHLRELPELRELVQGLPDSFAVRLGALRAPAVARLSRRFLAGDPEPQALVRQLVLLEIWDQEVLRPRAASARAATAR